MQLASFYCVRIKKLEISSVMCVLGGVFKSARRQDTKMPEALGAHPSERSCIHKSKPPTTQKQSLHMEIP
ncbi:hypothetical protein MUK42_27894 [Musa troglodytarum]|uniref:Uncharacterized protein n=1 Tax=Musa troglodytarum TaxID=320322 RepID=A0A9E7G7S2_9LILI|nr:hypothetical protein MUK42_27894 [Musa troglodytarum]